MSEASLYGGSGAVSRRRRRSDVDGRLRYPCSCGRLIADNEDWTNDFGDGERDDLCWGQFANHVLTWPEPESVSA